MVLESINKELKKLNSIMLDRIKNLTQVNLNLDVRFTNSTNDILLVSENKEKSKVYSSVLRQIFDDLGDDIKIHEYATENIPDDIKEKTIYYISFIDFKRGNPNLRNILSNLKSQYVVLFTEGLSTEVLEVATKNRFIVMQQPLDLRKLNKFMRAIYARKETENSYTNEERIAQLSY